MLKAKNGLYKFILILNLLLIVAGIAGSVFTMINKDAGAWLQFTGLAAILGFVSAVYYVFMGYSKDAAKYYKEFVALFVIFELVRTVAIGAQYQAGLLAAFAAVAYGCGVALLFGKDLGKNCSFWLAGVAIICSIGSIVAAASMNAEMKFFELMMSGCQFALTFMLGTMTYAKYLDKEARGTK